MGEEEGEVVRVKTLRVAVSTDVQETLALTFELRLEVAVMEGEGVVEREDVAVPVFNAAMRDAVLRKEPFRDSVGGDVSEAE